MRLLAPPLTTARPVANREVIAALRRGSPLATNLALVFFGLLTIELCRIGVHEYQHFTFGISEDIFSQIMLYLGAIAIIERSPANKWTLPIVFTVALLARLVCVFHPPFLSTDLYRYVWDGQVQGAGINPFRYIPADSHLSFLRDNAIYPHINRRDYAHTIYPPGAQAIFFAVTRIAPTEACMKLAMVACEAVTCVVLMRILALFGLPRERVVLYAWNPLCFWEIASSGHVDAAALPLMALALYACLRSKNLATGGWLGAATLVKLYPAMLLPALVPSLVTKQGRRRACQAAAVLVSVVVAGYSCYLSVGKGVFGFLGSYAQEEGIETGTRYFPLTFVNQRLHTAIPPIAYIGFCAVVLLAISLWALRRADDPNSAVFSMLVLATALNLCYAPHYPWYFLWLLPLLTIFPWRPAFYYVVASTFLFATRLGAPGAPMFLLNELLYGGFFLLLGLDLLLKRVRSRAPGPVRAPHSYPLHAREL